MIPVLKSLYILLFLVVILKHFALAQEGNYQFIYNGFKGAKLQLNGIAEIHPNGLLELTNTSKQQIGRAFYSLPLRVNTSSSNSSGSLSFSTNFVFAIVPEFPTVGGHGLTFTISPSDNLPGAQAAQFFGLFSHTSNGKPSDHILAIELDTIKSLDVSDIDNNHAGIDVNGVVSIESAPAAYYSDEERKNKSLELMSGNPIQAWIDYDEMEKRLNVTLAPITSSKPHRPLLSTALNLSDVILDSAYIGFSASTGPVLASHHYVLGWSFSLGSQAPSLNMSTLPSVPAPRKSITKADFTIIIPLVAVILLLLVAGPLFMRRKKYEELREDWEEEYGPQRFSYKALYKATKGFKDEEVLGSGGFGIVYRGVLPSSNTEVAIKKVSHGSQQGMKEFVAEIASMGRLRHRNLVQLLGYCRRKGELLLVYDYMPNGSLDKFLFRNVKPHLNWVHRYQILRGVASALFYLHEEWEQVVIHRDVKASNILLDAELNGRLGDFGLAKFHDHGANPQTSRVVGTVGYIAPELPRTGKATTSSDIFAFGILMLEMACGRKPVEAERPPEEMIPVEWVLEYWKKGSILQASDPRLEGDYDVKEMELVLKLGLLCAHTTPASRPSMRQVARYLDGNDSLPEIPLDGAFQVGFAAIGQEGLGDYILSFSVSSTGSISATVIESEERNRNSFLLS